MAKSKGASRATKPKSEFTFVNNFSKMESIIQEAPEKVLKVVGQNVTKEVRANLRQYYKKQTGNLDKSLGYFITRKKDIAGQPLALEIGFKKFYANFVFRPKNGSGARTLKEPITPVVQKNSELIAKMITAAIDDLTKRTP